VVCQARSYGGDIAQGSALQHRQPAELLPYELLVNFSCMMQQLGRFLVVCGVVLVVVGLLVWSGFGKGWLGRLPGDIHYTRGNFSVHFPIVTCLLISAVLTLLLWLFRK